MKAFKSAILMFLLGYMLLNMTGCGKQKSEERTPIALILLIGNHANSPHFDVPLTFSIEDTYSSFGNAGIIIIDGNPTLVTDDSETGILGCYSTDYLNSLKKISIDNNIIWKRDYLTPQTKKLLNAVDEYTADDPEVNLLEALHTAEKALNTLEVSIGTSVKKEIIILDSGISTSGYVNFLDPECLELLNSSQLSEEENGSRTILFDMLDNLEKQAELPDLHGISVTWYGLGQVSEPQPELTKLAVQNLQCIWGELLVRAGALPSDRTSSDKKYGMFLSTSAQGSIESTQYVTPVQWRINNPIENVIENDDNDTVEIPPSFELPEKQIYFYSNSDKPLLSEEELEASLAMYIFHFQSYPDDKVLLVGTTSSYNNGSISLSVKRAQKIKNIMMKAGVSENCINVIGLGYDPNFCLDDSPNGNFEENIAQENRSVSILRYESPRAQAILTAERNR